MTSLADLLGETEADRWKASRARGLVLWHRLDEHTALALVEAGVAEHDPAILAALGQVWTRRPEADPSLPEVLYLTAWLSRDHLAAEDGGRTGTGVIPLPTLWSYQLDHWIRQ
ncbi:hypothetical protein [Streptomyces sp. NPDC001389]|uniref:hypothetical protein n=1 Tax=Streptomyces sp. NPDC001389 TaxID=3364569 RepID=UPI0036C40EB2